MNRRTRDSMSLNSMIGFKAYGLDSMSSGGAFDVAGLRAQLEELEIEMARPDLWDDRDAAQNGGVASSPRCRQLIC